MSSTALDLVNKVLRTTGDYKQLAAISGSPAGIGERVVEFLNMTIEELESMANWPILQILSQGTADGLTDVYEFSDVATSVRADGPVSLWIAGHKSLEEVSHVQFDAMLASASLSGQRPEYFRRSATTAGEAQFQIYPIPAAGDIVNLTAFKKAARLDAAVPTGTTEFDDVVLVYGALMHMDAYDQQNRGYAQMFRNLVDQRLVHMYSNQSHVTSVDSYQ